MTLFPFIDLPPHVAPQSVSADLLAQIRSCIATPKLAGSIASSLGTQLLSLGFRNEAARFGEWGGVLQDAHTNKAVSVYVPCYNGGAFLKENLQAIFNQSFRPCEVIVVDDGSTDNSAEIAKKFPVRLIQHDANRGLAVSRNTALKAVGGEFVAGIDADTIVDRFWLERLMKEFVDDTVVGAAGRLVERHGLTSADAWRRTVMAQHHGDSPKRAVHLFGCNSVLRTKTLRALGGFNEGCKTSFDDIDLSERILKSGATTAYNPMAVCYHGRNDSARSIIESAYRWRVPPFEMQGAFTDASLLSAKWLTEVREGLKDVLAQADAGRGELLFITYLGIFVSIVIDFEYYFNQKPGEVRNQFAYAGLALVLRAVADIKNITHETRRELASRVVERFSKSFNSEQKISLIRAGVGEGLKAETLLQKLGVPLDEEIKKLIVALGELGSVLSLPPHIGEAINNNLMEVLNEDAKSFHIGKNRHAIVATRELLKTSWGAKSAAHLRSKFEGTSHIFLTDDSRWRNFELSEELWSAQPTHISLLTTPLETYYAMLLVPLVSRMPAAEIILCTEKHIDHAPVPVEVM